MKYLVFAMLLAVVACGCKKQVAAVPGDIDPVISTCALRLKHIAQAKQNWAAKLNRSAEDTPTVDDISPFMRGWISVGIFKFNGMHEEKDDILSSKTQAGKCRGF